MKKYTTVALFGSMFVGAAILLGLTGSDLSALAVASPTTVSGNNAGIFGHITMTVTDENGNITDYRQTDNTIGVTGQDCIGLLVFGTTSGTETCNTEAGLFQFIQLGTLGNGGSTGDCGGTQPGSGDSDLDGPILAATDTGMDKTQATSRVTNTSSGSGSTATLSATFTPSATRIVNEAALFNLVTEGSGDVMAMQCFAPVTVLTTDTLTLEWVITIGSN